ncbi:Hypothetical predicted protein [Marmota monax]|uniref:Uncharacterized protein n=1 Tax=Marmota monax TaxID=9995 RepID=A0A5E4BEG9_MARMO|nr:Hypothetical predicted protein [Marmota monax]
MASIRFGLWTSINQDPPFLRLRVGTFFELQTMVHLLRLEVRSSLDPSSLGHEPYRGLTWSK